MLELQHLTKNYNNQKAVDDISLSIPEGKILGLLGPNGAGKSSLLRMITGITLPDEGKILFDGEIFIAKKHMQEIGYMPEERGLYKKMKVREQILYLAQLKGLSLGKANECINYWFEKLDMQSWADKKVEDLSKGMSQKMQFVTTVLHNPKLLILDEPFSGLDPVNAQIIKNQIFELREKGTTIIFSTHRMEQVEEICEEIALMNQGKIILNGKVAEIKQQFKENKYELILENETENLPFEYLEKSGKVLTIKLKENENSLSILKKCVEGEILVQSFKEVLPTFNEIFIGLVKQTAARQFDN